MKIFEKFGDKNFHTSIVTTFGIDFDTYEHIALPRLRGSGCRNNILLADSRMLTYALDGASLLPRSAGRHYTISGISPKGVFHPKIILQLGRQAGRLIVSSANMTASGIAGNLELAGIVTCNSDDLGERQLISAAWHYLNRLIEPDQEAITHQLNWAKARTKWLVDTEPANKEVTLLDGSVADFLVNDGNKHIGNRFLELVQDRPVKRLIVLSPYWDEELVALKRLASQLKAKEVVILIDQDKQLFPSDALKELPDVKILNIAEFKHARDRFVHAKAIIAQTEDFDHVLYGSANCTLSALGSGGFGGVNDEACLYRRLPPNSLLPNLELDSFLTNAVAVSKEFLPKFKRSEPIPLDESARRFPGRFESVFDSLYWWPPKNLAIETCQVELFGLNETLLPGSLSQPINRTNGQLRFLISGTKERPAFARLRFANGESSALAVVMLVDELRDDVREARGKKAEIAAMQLSEETEEGFWLLEVLDTLETAEAEQKPDMAPDNHHFRNNASNKEQQSTFKTLSYEQFMAGRRLKSEDAGFTRLGIAGSEVSLVRSFLNRVLLMEDFGSVPEAADEDGMAQSLTNMGDETGNAQDLIERGADFSEKQTELSEKLQRELERRRNAARIEATRDQIVAAVSNFNKKIWEKAKTKPLSFIDILRLRVILMVLAASGWSEFNSEDAKANKPIRTQIQVLLTSGDQSWPRLIGQTLYTFFGGPIPAILSIEIGSEHEQLPHDILECLVTCLWAANACQLVASSHDEVKNHLTSFVKRTNEVYLQSKFSSNELSSEPVINIMKALNTRFESRLGLDSDALIGEHKRRISPD